MLFSPHQTTPHHTTPHPDGHCSLLLRPTFVTGLASQVGSEVKAEGARENVKPEREREPFVVPFSNSLHRASSGKMEIIVMALTVGFIFAVLLFISTSLNKKGGSKISHQQLKDKKIKAYTSAEVELHNSREDCWIIVKNKVYDVTPYVEEHPGGDAILKHAGGDSTEGFYGPQHASRVFDMVDEFYIGDLKM